MCTRVTRVTRSPLMPVRVRIRVRVRVRGRGRGRGSLTLTLTLTLTELRILGGEEARVDLARC